MGTLYIVPTPIGNLEDITLRALRVLKEVDLVACEDTRQTLKLLTHFGIQKPLLSFYTYNQVNRSPQLVRELSAGKNIALVSDSGTPGISDPGSYLIEAVLRANIPVVPLPGASAAITALVASGLPTDGFVFLGFLRRKAGKLKKELQEAARLGKTIVFYESPFRIKKTLALCEEVFAADTGVAVARELTKKFEEFTRGSLGDVRRALQDREIKGELVVMVSPGTQEERETADNDEGQDNDHD
jgi:16S rRNA (cytidine1402-2'-O)-methyltransferase